MHLPTYSAALARRAWQIPRVRRFAYTYLVALVVLAVLQGCGGGDPEDDAAGLDTPATVDASDPHDVRIPRQPCRDEAL